MEAMLIIALVLCSLVTVLDLGLCATNNSDAGGVAFGNLIALAPTIVALALALAR